MVVVDGTRNVLAASEEAQIAEPFQAGSKQGDETEGIGDGQDR